MFALRSAVDNRVERLAKQFSILRYDQVALVFRWYFSTATVLAALFSCSSTAVLFSIAISTVLQVVVPDANVAHFAAGFSTARKAKIPEVCSKCRHPFVPGCCALDVFQEALLSMGLVCSDWENVMKNIREHHLPVAPAPAPVAPGGVVDLDSDEGDSDHHDEDHEDLSDGEGGEQELDAMEGAVIAAAEGGSRDALKAAIAQLKANFRKMRVNRNYWRRTSIQLKKERDEAHAKIRETDRAGKKEGDKKGTISRYFSVAGGLAAGLRCNLCHTPAAYFSSVLQIDVSRYTATRWEI